MNPLLGITYRCILGAFEKIVVIWAFLLGIFRIVGFLPAYAKLMLEFEATRDHAQKDKKVHLQSAS